MKNLLNLVLILFIGISFTACSGGGIEADAKAAAAFRCEMTKLEKEGKPTGDAMKKMNEIRKKYYKKDNSKEFDELFEKYKAECE